MTSRLAFWRKQPQPAPIAPPMEEAEQPQVLTTAAMLELDIEADDPVMGLFQNSSGPIDMEKVSVDSPGVHILRENGVRIAVPLVSQGELIGVINLGPRLSDQDYSSDDRKLLNDLATQAAPAVRVAQLVYQQKKEAAERERIEQELRVARIIQQTLLPKNVPDIEGWKVTALWQPARAVSGDFYDFYYFEDGRLGIVIADVTDKGVPAALVMATTRSILRAVSEHVESPGQVLQRANDVLVPDMPPKMFVTCLFAILNPATGHLRFANAGHNLPFCSHRGEVIELRATGMPLGLLPGMDYEENEFTLDAGDRILLYSDGLVEAHNSQRQMFGTPRLHDLLCEGKPNENVAEQLIDELWAFTGADWEQEDDVTLVTLEYLSAKSDASSEIEWQTLQKFEIESAPGKEREAVARIIPVLEPLVINPTHLEKMKTAVAEATMNAMEHGNQYDPTKSVTLETLRSDTQLQVQITDFGGDQVIPDHTEPNLEAKLAGEQSPRGWGLFLIKSMCDDLEITSDGEHHTLRLYFNL
ncbi:MAG: SpoIIE family protein phosphatase [Caldilineales bacterium]|nr:SpoIIE family protein phosphatase [Caldilineales bacterium]